MKNINTINRPIVGGVFVGLLLFGLVVATPATPVLAQTNPAAVTDENTLVTKSEVSQALIHTDKILSDSDQIKTTSDTDSIVKAVTSGSEVSIPRDASDGVILDSTDGPQVEITLPNANNAQDAQNVANGTVAYPGSNGSANAVQATEDGGLRMLTIIDNPDAPTEYDYQVTVPGGGRIELTTEGGAVVLDAQQQPIMLVAAPWAKDANGRMVQTYFTTDGLTLTQHIAHNVPGVVYPVAADPYVFRWYGVEVFLNRNQTNNVMFGMAGVAAAGLWIPDPSISKVVAGALAISAGYANWVYNRGGCLMVKIYWGSAPQVGHYYGGSCR